MKRRLAIALLTLLVALGGVGVCARGVQACAAMGAASADCCGKGARLATGDCCCPAKAERTSNLPSSVPGQTSVASPVLAVAPAILAPFALTACLPGSPVEARAFAPPDTPVSRHISLLL